MKRLLNSEIRVDPGRSGAAFAGVVGHAHRPLWQQGPAAGIYVASSWEAADAAVARYLSETGGADCYVDNSRTWYDQVVNLGPSHPMRDGTGIFSPQLGDAPHGALVVMGLIQLTQWDWFWEGDKLQEACRWVLKRGYRIIAVVQSPRMDVVRSDLLLTLRGDDTDVTHLERVFRGVVGSGGQLKEVVPFGEERAPPVSTHAPRADGELPAGLRFLLDVALRRKRRGFLIVSGDSTNAERERMFKVALSATQREGPVALVLSSFDDETAVELESVSSNGGLEVRRSTRFPDIPLYPSLESAYASGYRRIACWGELVECDLSQYVHDVCFVICARSVCAKDAFTLGTGAGQDASMWNILDGVIAVLCWATLRGHKGAFPIYDAFVPGRDAIEQSPHQAVWEALSARRQIRWEDQVTALIASKQVTVEEVQEYLAENEVILPEEDEEWDQVSTTTGLLRWLKMRAGFS